MRPLLQDLMTPRLRIAPVTAEIAAAAREGSSALGRVLGAEPSEDWGRSSMALIAHSAGAARMRADAPPIRAVVIARGEDVIIGDVRFEATVSKHIEGGEVEIGYSIAASRRRCGFAVEASGAVLDWLFSEGRARGAFAGCARGNIASVRTLRRLGFWLDGSAGTAFWWLITPELRAATRNADARLKP